MSRKKNAKKPKTNDVVSVLDTAFNTPSEQPWLVYKFAGNGGLVFQSVHDALYDEAVHGALEEARTWGEFRRLLPAGEWEAIAERLESREEGEETEPWLHDHAPFDAELIPGFSDGDYPRWAQQDMDTVLPPDILKKYAQVKHSVHNGHFWYIAHDQADAIVAALRDQGFRVDEATFLRGW